MFVTLSISKPQQYAVYARIALVRAQYKDQYRQITAEHFVNIKDWNRESRTLVVLDLAGLRASKTSAWLDLYNVVI